MLDISLMTMDERKSNIIAVANSEGGLFCEAAENFLDAMHTYQVQAAKVESYTEQCEREYDINLAKAELKCYQEDGTTDDMAYLEEAASEGAVAKMKKLLDAAIEAIRQFFSKIKTGTMKFICSAESRQVLNKAEKKIKLNPILAHKRVKIMSTKNQLSIINSFKSKVDKSCAKTIKGILGEHERKTIMDTKDEFRRAFKNAIAGEAALKTITVAGLVAQLSKDIEKLPSYIHQAEDVNTAVLTRLKGSVSGDAAAAAQSATNACVNFRNELVREEVNVVIDGVMQEMRVLKAAINKKNGNQEVDVKKVSRKGNVKSVNESAEEDNFEIDVDEFLEDGEEEFLEDAEDVEEVDGDERSFEEAFEDSINFDDDEYLEDAGEEEDPELDSYEESSDEGDTVDATSFSFFESDEDVEEEEGENYEESAEDVEGELEELYSDIFK